MRRTDEQAPIRERWTNHPTGAGDEATAGALLRTAADFTIGEKKLAEIHARLRGSTRKRSRTMRPAGRVVRRLAFAAALACCGGALSASVMHALDRRAPERSSGRTDPSVGKDPVRRDPRRRATPIETPPAVTPDEAAAPAAVPGVAAPDQQPAAPTSSAPAPAPTPSPSTNHRLRPGRSLASRETSVSAPAPGPPAMPDVRWPSPVAPAATSASAWPPQPVATPVVAPVGPAMAPSSADGPSSLARESRLLARAIATLRQDGQPDQALRILDEYRAQFGSGALAPEATATRIEALLRVGRNREALALLDGQHLTARGVARAMMVARGELRADKGRYAAALADFDAVLSTSAEEDALAERALWGRATCRGKSADWQGARRDWEDYLATFPHGAFAERARAALEKLR